MVVPIIMRTRILHNIASHIITLQLYLKVTGTNIPSLLSLILYSLFNFKVFFFSPPSKDCSEYSFCSVGLEIFVLSTGAMSFVSETFHVLILTCTVYEIHPVKEETQLNKPVQGLEAFLTLENLCHKLLPGSYQKQLFFPSWRRKSRCLIF